MKPRTGSRCRAILLQKVDPIGFFNSRQNIGIRICTCKNVLVYWARSENKKLLYHVCIITQIILVICYIISSLRSDNRDILDYFSDIIYIFNFNFQQLNFHIDASSCMLCRLLFIICMSSIYSSSSVTDHVDFHLIS